MGKHRFAFVAVTSLACGMATNALAELRVEGDLNAVRVSTSGDKLSDILSGLSARLPVTYRTSVPLSREVKGTFSGSFSQVIARLLDGYNYIIKNDQPLTAIIVLNEKGEVAVISKAVSEKSPASRWH
jgi:hypothetical protein